MKILRFISNSGRFHRFVARVLYKYSSLVFKTNKWLMNDVDNADHVKDLAKFDGNVILCMWHEHLFMVPYAKIAGSRILAVTSVSLQGKIIAAFLQCFGIDSVHGNSKHRGRSATLAMIKAVGEGACAAIVPDGSRGPRRQISNSGVFFLSFVTQKKIVPLAYHTTCHFRLNTWDRVLFPLPFGRGALVYGKAIDPPTENSQQAKEQFLRTVELVMNETAAKAEFLSKNSGADKRVLPF